MSYVPITTASFTTPTLTRISNGAIPTYATLAKAQYELNQNATAIHSNRGGGCHGHLALLVSPEKYLLIAGVEFEPPTVPPAPSTITGTTTIVTQGLAQNTTDWTEYRTYKGMDSVLKAQLIAAVNPDYIEIMADPQLGYTNVTTYALLTHLWTTYGQITTADLTQNLISIQAPWDTNRGIDSLFLQIQTCRQYAEAGDDPISDLAAIRFGYENIFKTGRFEHSCRSWREKANDLQKSYTGFCEHFRWADNDRRNNVTTQSAGYHGMNRATATAPPAAWTGPTPTAVVQGANAANSPPAAPGNHPAPAVPPLLTYCWTHGSSINASHTSATCKHKADGHQENATNDNKMGGSSKIWTAPRTPRV